MNEMLVQNKIRPIEFRRDEKFSNIYINNTMAEISPWDLRLKFGQMVEATEEKLVILDMVHVSMSPPHAKALLKALQASIDKYESTFGPVPEIKLD